MASFLSVFIFVLLVVLAGKELVQKLRLPLLLPLRRSVRAGRLCIAGIEPIFNLC